MAACPVHFRTPSRLERLWPALTGGGALVVVAAVATLLRFRDLGLRTFQPAESTASLIASQLARGGGYEHLPVTHGPFHYAATAAAFRLFGTGDVTARAAPALFGVLLALLPLLCARQLGRAGSILAALLLAVSPTMLYYSRFAGPDIYLAFFTLATAMVAWRYLVQPHRAWLYLLALTLAGMVVTTEMALALTAIFAAYFAWRTGNDFIAQAAEPDAPATPRTHYDVLGVASDAPTREVRLAYKRALDRRDPRADREALAEAFRVLTTANRREAYDRRLAQRARLAAERAQRPPAGVPARLLILAAGGIIALLWPFAGPARRALHLKRLPDAAAPLTVIAMLTLPFYGPLVEKLPFIGDRGFHGQEIVYVIGGTTHIPGGETPVMLITLGALFAVAGVIGLAWRWHVWVICWAAFYGVTVTMFTGFFTNRGGLWTGLWGTLDYWWRPEAQHADGPATYYATLLPAYETLPIAVAALATGVLLVRGGARNRAVGAIACAALAAAIAAPPWLTVVAHHRTMWEMVVAVAAVLALRLDHGTKFLAFWAVAAFFAFSTIGRKEPWLALHIALPLALLAAKLAGDALAAIEMPRLALPAPSLRSAAPRRLAQAAVVSGLVVAVAFTARTAALASWGHGAPPQLSGALATRDHGDTPVELIQPDRVAPDVREVLATVDRAAAASGKGRQLPVALDTSYGFAQAWLWYLRDYTDLRLEDMQRGYQVPDGAIALFDARNRAKVDVSTASTALTFTESWSFPGASKTRSASAVASDLASARWWTTWSRYLVDRTSIGALSERQGMAYIPQTLRAALPAGRQSDVLAASVTPAPLGPPAPGQKP